MYYSMTAPNASMARSPDTRQPFLDRPTLAERILATMRRETGRRPFPCWELCKRLWINWRTDAGRVPGDASQIVMRVLKRLERDGKLQRDHRGWCLAAFTEEPTMWHLRADLTKMKFKEFRYPMARAVEQFCHVGVFTANNRRPIVVISERPGNNGVSVTQATESIAAEVCRRFAMNPGLVTWIEHHPADEVTFGASWESVEYDCSGLEICNPHWRPMTPEAWAALAITPEMIETAMELPR